jgi:hypothetical protein
MNYQVISTDPAARGKIYYKIKISEEDCIILKLDDGSTQEIIDNEVEKYIQREKENQRILELMDQEISEENNSEE